MTRIDLDGFIRQLEGVKRQLGRSNPVRLALGNEVLFLRNMAQLVAEMKAAVADLKASTDALEKDVTINRADFRKAIQQVILQARKGPEFLQRKGERCFGKLPSRLIDKCGQDEIACWVGPMGGLTTILLRIADLQRFRGGPLF